MMEPAAEYRPLSELTIKIGSGATPRGGGKALIKMKE